MTPDIFQPTQYVILLGLTVVIYEMAALISIVVVSYIRDLFR